MIKTTSFKKKYSFLLLFFVTGIIISSNFISEHFATDTYVLYIIGYSKYSRIFLRAARYASAFSMYLANFLQLPYKYYIIGMSIISQLALSLATFILYSTLSMMHNSLSFTKKLLLAIASFLTIYNFMTIENLIFAESGIMCIGILLVILSCKVFIKGNRHSKVFSLLLLLSSSFFYQGILVYYIPIVILFISYEYKDNFKKGFLQILKAVIIYVSCLAINYCFITFIGEGDKRLNGQYDFTDNLILIYKSIKEMLFSSFNIIPKYIFIISLILLFLIILVGEWPRFK